MFNYECVINGKSINSKNKIQITSPVDLKVCGEVPELGVKEISMAFKSARDSQKNWEDLTLFDRIKYMNKWKELIIKNREHIANIMIKEIAKPLKDSLTEVDRTIEYIDYTIEEAKRMYPEIYTGDGMNVKNKYGIFDRIAKGVILAISPFNYPINLSMAKIAPSLIAGNTVVFKPATSGSIVGTFMSQLSLEAGLPAGVFNCVTGRGSVIGDELIKNPEINLISFTGSVPVGNRIKELAKGKDLILELGGKDPAIIIDGDLEKISSEIIGGAFSYSGQRCTGIKRVLVLEKDYDKIIKLLKDKVNKLSVGSPVDGSVIIPVIDIKTAEYLDELVSDAKAKGATIETGKARKGNLFYPTLISNVSLDMKIAWEEPFGPILPIIKCKSVEEMIEITNKSNFGLQASLFSNNISQAIKVAKQLNVGTVNLNGKPQRGPDNFPFLGVKDSGLGVQGIGETLKSVTRLKGIVINY
ncbi:NADP-dependent glyceraldehyde-3-phosphate dehydrogenase [Spiroplasma endosymbiont of Anurida maritima]|uniref:NADP-dependent glyceraldehyde-3-phosphate dehydrogenase n=1 Tax=Spiroplasma endosymbiont of Anurida maritima TaxID=2967972 RepID=UPI0036D3D7E8